MKHPYAATCDCPRCRREHGRRTRQAATDNRRRWQLAPRPRYQSGGGWLGTAEARDAYDSGRPMSSDDY